MSLEARIKKIERAMPSKTGNSLLDRLAGFGVKEVLGIKRYYYFDQPLPTEVEAVKKEFTKLKTKEQTKLLNQLKEFKKWDKLPLWLFDFLPLEESVK